MYDIIKTVISSGRYELSDMLGKIDTIWLQGGLTEEQRTELVELARQNALPENSYTSVQKQIDSIFTNLGEMAAAIRANTDAITRLCRRNGRNMCSPQARMMPTAPAIK